PAPRRVRISASPRWPELPVTRMVTIRLPLREAGFLSRARASRRAPAFPAIMPSAGGRSRTNFGALPSDWTIFAPVGSRRGALACGLLGGAGDRSGPALPDGAAGPDAGGR